MILFKKIHDFMNTTGIRVFHIKTKNDKKNIHIYRLSYDVDGQVDFLNDINLLEQHDSHDSQNDVVFLVPKKNQILHV